MCKDEGMGIAPWGALGGGKFKTEEQRQTKEGRNVELNENDIKISQTLEKVASRLNTSITSVALAYVMHKAPFVFPIVGGRKVDHLKDNIEALTLEITAEDIKEIESAVPFDLGFPHTMLWGREVPDSVQDVGLLKMAGTFDIVPERQVWSIVSTFSKASLTCSLADSATQRGRVGCSPQIGLLALATNDGPAVSSLY